MSFAQLKRDAQSGKLHGELIERFGETEIIERLRGLRRVVGANTVGITFLNSDGKRSECRVERAALMEYTGDTLTIYNPGLRDLNDEESRIIQGWKDIENTDDYQRRAEIDALSDGSSTYWQKVGYFRKSGKKYLTGGEEQNGCKFDFNTGKIRDKSVRGDAILKYKMTMEA